MALDKKYQHKHTAILRDTRPMSVRIAAAMQKPADAGATFVLAAIAVYMNVWALCTAVSAQSCLKMTEPARTKRFVSLRLV